MNNLNQSNNQQSINKNFDNSLNYDQKHFKYPTLGSTCKAKIIRPSYISYTISIIEIEGVKSRINYKGTIKIENYECKYQYGDIIECIIVGYGDNGINCILKQIYLYFILNIYTIFNMNILLL